MSPSGGTTNSLSGHFQALLHLRQLLLDHTCAHLTPPITPPIVLDHSFNLRSALSLLLANGLSSAPLLDQSNQLAGSFSLSDVLYTFCLLNCILESPNQKSALSATSTLAAPAPSSSSSPLTTTLFRGIPHNSRKHNQQQLPTHPSSNLTSDSPVNSLKPQNNFFQLPIAGIRELRPGPSTPPLHIHPQAALLDAGEHLYRSHHRRIPLLDIHPITGKQTLKRLITPQTLLHFLATHPRSCLGQLSFPIESLRIGSRLPIVSFNNLSQSVLSGLNPRDPNPLIAVTEENTIRELVRIFLQRRIGAVPIIDQIGGVVDVYELVDVVDLFASPKPPAKIFELSIRQAITLRSRKVTGITFCSLKDSLGSLLKYVSENFVRMFIVVENETSCDIGGGRPTRARKLTKRNKVKDKLIGMITLPDILDHIVGFKPPAAVQKELSPSAAQHQRSLLSATSSGYSSSLVSCSSNTSSVSFCSPINTLGCNDVNVPASSKKAQSSTPLSLPVVLSYPPSLYDGKLLASGSNHLASTASRTQRNNVHSTSSYLISRSQPLPDLGCSRSNKQQEISIAAHRQIANRPVAVSLMRTPGKVSITQSSQHISPPPMNKIAEFAAQMICYLWFAEPSTLQKSTTSSYTRDQSRFELTLSTERLGSAIDGKINGSSISSGAINQAQLIPNPEFVVFIHNLLSTTQVSHSVVLLALFYIHRLKCLNPIKPNAKSEYRIGAVSLMLANKMLDDHTYTAKTWSEVSRLPLSSLNDGEIEFLQGLNFELHVNMRNFNAWFRLLHGMVHLKDCHTAAALAAGPRTRWFKKMRIVSGEGLSVLEGLVSPIRNSGMMKLEVEKELNKSPLVFATSKSQSRPDSQFMAINSCQTIRGCQPNHPYNLRRSARGHLHAISSNSSATPLTAGWAGGVESNSRSCIASYSAILPSSNPISAATSHEPSRFKDNFDHILSSKSRMLAHPTQSSSKVGFNGKRSYSEVDSADEGDYFNGENPSKRTISWNINETISGATERLPLIAHPQDIQANANYLGNAIMPSSTIINQQACPGAELYFHSLAAGRRATEQPVRQGVTSDNQNLGNEGYILGSQPWQKGIPMDEGCGARRPYSSFSNAGLPGVVWAEGTITGKSNETFQLSNQYSSNHSRLCYLPNNETPFLGYPPSSTLSQPSFRHDCQAQY